MRTPPPRKVSVSLSPAAWRFVAVTAKQQHHTSRSRVIAEALALAFSQQGQAKAKIKT